MSINLHFRKFGETRTQTLCVFSNSKGSLYRSFPARYHVRLLETPNLMKKIHDPCLVWQWSTKNEMHFIKCLCQSNILVDCSWRWNKKNIYDHMSLFENTKQTIATLDLCNTNVFYGYPFSASFFDIICITCVTKFWKVLKIYWGLKKT